MSVYVYFSSLQSDKQILGAQGLTFGDLRQSMGSVAFEMAARKSCYTHFTFYLLLFSLHLSVGVMFVGVLLLYNGIYCFVFVFVVLLLFCFCFCSFP